MTAAEAKRSNPFPTPIAMHELLSALQATENARDMLAVAYTLVKSDYALKGRVESVGRSVKALFESIEARATALADELAKTA